MKIGFDKKKSAEIFNGLVQNTVDLGKKAVASTKAGVTAIVNKTKTDEQERKLKKYNPVFPEDYQSDEFHIPNIIVIVDDAVRRDVEICDGAIGWLDKDHGEEVLYLYDEAVKFSKIAFIPAPICNSVYCVDSFDRSHFIESEYIFSRTIDEKKAELQHIAECIGAKRCTIYIGESTASSNEKQIDANLGGELSAEVLGKQEKAGGGNLSLDYGSTNGVGKSQYGYVEAEFGGLRFPRRPKLKWFANDDNITNLVNSCCTGRRRVKKMTLELAGSVSSSMSHSVAATIDGVFRKHLNFKGGGSFKSNSTNELQSKMTFYIEF